MQHVLKREPCHKCQLPVFLAERLLHGSRLYHRTCLRCARCQSQLTPGSFYETEQDGEFCCETCPDEDASSSSATGGKDSTDLALPVDEARQSFSNKLALFQMRSAAVGDERGKGLLNKSLSDEEKSKSLKRLTALYSMHSADAGLGVMDYKSGSGVRNSFLTTQLTDETKNPHQVEESEAEDEEDDNEEDEEDSEDEEPPSLPTVQPPPVVHSPISLDIVPDQNTLSSLKALEKPPLPVKPSELVVSIKMPSALSTTTDETIDDQPNTTQEQSIPVPPETDLIKDEPTSPVKDVPTEIQAVGDRLSLVLARLKQFEANPAEPTPDLINSNRVRFSKSPSSSRHHSFDDPVVPVAEPVSFETVDHSISSIVQETTEGHSMKEELDHLQELAMRQAVNEINEEVQQQEIDKAQQDVIAEVVLPEAEVMVPTPRKRLSKANKEEPTKPTAMARTTATPIVVELSKPTSNPFGDDEEDEDLDAPEASNIAHDPSKRNSFNPFDSSDDEVELDKLATIRPNVQPVKSVV